MTDSHGLIPQNDTNKRTARETYFDMRVCRELATLGILEYLLQFEKYVVDYLRKKLMVTMDFNPCPGIDINLNCWHFVSIQF